MFIEVLIYDAGTDTGHLEILQTDHFMRSKDNGDVPVDPGAVDTPSTLIKFPDGTDAIILLPYSDFKLRLSALVGVTTDTGTLT